jgi:hypothetical protein
MSERARASKDFADTSHTVRPPARRISGRRYAPMARQDVVVANLRNDPRSAESDEERKKN